MIKNKVLDIKNIFKIYLKILKINLKYFKISNKFLFYEILDNNSKRLLLKTIFKNFYQIYP